MAKRPDTSSVTQEEVESLFTQHDLYGQTGEEAGNDESPVSEEDSTEDEGDESEDQEEAQGNDESEESGEDEGTEEETEEPVAESDEDEGEGDEAADLDWSKIPAKHRAAFEKANTEATKWQKAHGKLQSQLTQESKTRREEENTLTTLRQKAAEADQWESLLAKHPELQDGIAALIQKIRDPYKDVPDYLRQDPVFQKMQQMNQRLEERLSQFEKNLKPVEDLQAQQVRSKNQATLDALLNGAHAKFKTMFGRDVTDAEKQEVIKFMVENKYFPRDKDGKPQGHLVAFEVFGPRWEQHLKQNRDKQLREKAKKFGARNKTLNMGRQQAKKDADTPEEAVAMALAEQGYGT